MPNFNQVQAELTKARGLVYEELRLELEFLFSSAPSPTHYQRVMDNAHDLIDLWNESSQVVDDLSAMYGAHFDGDKESVNKFWDKIFSHELTALPLETQEVVNKICDICDMPNITEIENGKNNHGR